MEDTAPEDASHQQQYNITTDHTTAITTPTDTSLLSNMIMEAAAKEAMKNDLQQQSVVAIGELVSPPTFSTSISPEVIPVPAIPQNGGAGEGGNEGVNNNSSSSSPMVRPVKHRPTFTEEQISSMETIFKHRQYLTPIERESVATAVGLSAQQVRVWFQNRRQKAKQFLAYKQHQQNGGVSVSSQNDDDTSSDNNEHTGSVAGQTDITSILSKLQKSSVDSQLLQLMIPPNKTTSQVIPNSQETLPPLQQESKVMDTVNTQQVDAIPSTKDQPSVDSTSNPTSLSIVTAPNGTISINPQSLLYLAPLLMSSINSASPNSDVTITSSSAPPTSTSSSNTITTNALQLILQSLSSNIKLPMLPVGIPGLNKKEPMKAGSPVPVEETMEESNDISISETMKQGEDKKEVKVGDQGAGPSATTPQQQKTPPISLTTGTGILSNEVLQQILQASIDKSKVQLAATPTGTQSPTLTLPPSLSLSLTSTAAERPARKKRQVFSGHQIAEMEKHFETSPYIDNKERETLAAQIGLVPDQVKVWFQNRRTKKSRLSWRQQAKENQEQS